MAQLDYAFLAEYAKVEPGGNLTAIGASYTHIAVPAFPGQHLLAVAGRVRTALGEAPRLTVRVATPDERLNLEMEGDLHAGPDARPYGKALDTVGIQFALSFVIPLTGPGLYRVNLDLDGEHVRMLAFTAAQLDAA